MVSRQIIRELEERFSNSDRLYRLIINEIEKPLIEDVLIKTRGNQYRAAKILGINRNTLHAKIKKLGIMVGRWKAD
ncbi:MAG: hypothetical protein JW714_03775 [Candidatus Omnitrophica bacterium]|nr:hypothetical protein [Candidatus Omnitrophota bacterium]